MNKNIFIKTQNNLGNDIFQYLAYVLLCIKNNYEYELSYNENIYINAEKYTFYKGVDHFGDDYLYTKSNQNINNLKTVCDDITNVQGLNTLGFLKKKIDIYNLKSNQYIDKNNNGIYVKNILYINDNNYLDILNTNIDNNRYTHIIINGYFHFDNIYLDNKREILEFIEKYKDIHYIHTYLLKDILNMLNIDDKEYKCTMDTLTWCNAYFSKNIEKCYSPIKSKIFYKDTIYYDLNPFNLSNIKIMVITLKEYPERLENIKSFLDKMLKYGIQHEIIYGVNGKNIKIYDTERDNIKLLYNNFETFYYNKNIRAMKLGEFGCAWSHINIYKKLITENDNMKYLVLEDDALLIKDIEVLLEILKNIPNNLDYSSLANSLAYNFEKNNKINNYFYNIKKNYFNCTLSYIITKSGALKIIKYINNQINVPSDNIISEIYLNNYENFKVYVPYEHLFIEYSNSLSIIDVIDKR